MKGKIKTGVIGLGDCSNNRFLPALAKENGYELISAADVLSKQLKLPYVQSLLGKKDIKYERLQPWGEVPKEFFKNLDLVFIASPNEHHLHQTIDALENSDAVVLVEKPLVTNEQELVTLSGIVKKNNASSRLVCNDHYLFKPATMHVQKSVNEIIRKYGKIKSVEAMMMEEGNLIGHPRENWLLTPSAGGGVLMDTGIHMAQVLTKVFDAEFLKCKKAAAYNMYPNRKFQCETGFYGEFLTQGRYFKETKKPNVTMRIAKGMQSDKKQISMKLEGGQLHLNYDYNGKGEWGVLCVEKTDGHLETRPFELRKDIYLDPYRNLLRELNGFVRNRKQPYLSLEDAKNSLGVVFMGYSKLGGIYNMYLEKKHSKIEHFLDWISPFFFGKDMYL